jgi:hypothetical protein
MAVSSAGLRPNSDYSEGNFKEKEKFVTGPRWAPDVKTNCRKLTSTSTPTDLYVSS